ncbi:MAG: amylo-alpha-1,6-glucosidase [Kofleriaceae bacterium]
MTGSAPATEWLEPDGRGGFAMGTADGIRTRRYHAVLLVARHPPDGRVVLVADLEVFVETPAGRFALSSHRYPGGVVHPDGAQRLTGFTHAPWPRWELTLPGGAQIACELVVEHAQVADRAPRVALRWTRLAGTITSLHVQPLLAGRDYHATHHENPAFRFEPELAGDCVTWRPYADLPSIHCAANALYQHAPDWYRAFTYAAEAERGLDSVEDLASPGVFTFDLASGAAAMVLSTAWLPDDPAMTAAQIFTAEAARRAGCSSPLARAADAYIVVRAAEAPPGGRTIIAGYPWFADWGRDTFISLRGLCLATGRRADARAILAQWATVVSRGMLPNRFDEQSSSPEYNAVDAALWFVIAAAAYLDGSGAAGSGASDVTTADRDLLGTAISAIVDGYQAGTRHGIRVDDDGLLACGEPGTQLTWMDAKVGDHYITPRIGKPVEIQALWINALIIAGRTTEAVQARAAFDKFWDPRRRQLHDVLDADHVRGAVDSTCRPNQIFAIGGVPHAILSGERARAIVDTVERVLWTPAGLRTLDPADPRYHPRYLGNPGERDAGYHNGAVWPWLAGPFIEAWLRVHDNTADARRTARTRFLTPLLSRLTTAGLDHLSEIYDGDPPHRPAGCPFQAWSLAEALRLDQLLG